MNGLKSTIGWDIRLSRTQTSAVSEHARPELRQTGHDPLWDEVKLIDRYPHWYSRRFKEAIHTGFHLNNINKNSGLDGYDQTTWQAISTTADRWEISFFLTQCQQCFGSNSSHQPWARFVIHQSLTTTIECGGDFSGSQALSRGPTRLRPKIEAKRDRLTETENRAWKNFWHLGITANSSSMKFRPLFWMYLA